MKVSYTAQSFARSLQMPFDLTRDKNDQTALAAAQRRSFFTFIAQLTNAREDRTKCSNSPTNRK